MDKDYLPSDLKFDVPEQLGFPVVIFDEATNVEDVRKLVSENLIALQEKDTVAIRFMDEYEKEMIRDEYEILLENKKPRLSVELETIVAESRNKIKEARAKLTAVLTEIDDLVSQVRNGTKRVELKFGETYRIPVGENYLYYTWINYKFRLALVRQIPSWERTDVFNSSEKNATTFKEMFGCDVKMIQLPVESIENDFDVEEE